MLYSQAAFYDDPFRNGFHLTVDTTKAGSASDTFVLPTTTGTYNYVVSWGDGVIETVTSSSSQTHVYGSSGTYTIKIIGTFPRVYFNNGGDDLKVLSVQLGDVGWTSFLNAFNGCANLGYVTGPSNTSKAVSCQGMFRGCTNLTSVSDFSTESATRMDAMFNSCSSFNQALGNGLIASNVSTTNGMFNGCSLYNQPLPSSFDTAKVANMAYMFSGCTAYNQAFPAAFVTSKVDNLRNMFASCTSFKQSLASFDMSLVTLATSFLSSCDINAASTTTNYDATLVSLASQTLQSGLSINFGNSKYSAGTGKPARDSIIACYSWSISDGGQA